MNARRVVIVIAPAALVAVAYLYFRGSGPSPQTPPTSSAQSSLGSAGTEATPPRSAGFAAGGTADVHGEEPSHLVDGLNSRNTDIKADLRLLNDVFVTYRSSTHQDDPVGENVEITAALTGRNGLGYAFVPKDSPAVNAKGELCDRWGTPFFFHQLSGAEMEIRSAGPDKKLWTADDTVMTP